MTSDVTTAGPDLSEYEKQRLKRIAENEAEMKAVGVSAPMIPSNPQHETNAMDGESDSDPDYDPFHEFDSDSHNNNANDEPISFTQPQPNPISFTDSDSEDDENDRVHEDDNNPYKWTNGVVLSATEVLSESIVGSTPGDQPTRSMAQKRREFLSTQDIISVDTLHNRCARTPHDTHRYVSHTTRTHTRRATTLDLCLHKSNRGKNRE